MNARYLQPEPQVLQRPFHLLCVDDDPYTSDALARSFAEFEIQVLRAYDGMQGYWRVLKDKPAGVISDLSMPNGNGIEMIQCLRRNATTEFLPIIVLTGTNDRELRRQLRKLNVSAVLEKPTNATEILLELYLADFFSESLQIEHLLESAIAASA